ncbi:unnamed protein product [Anisakis simplex]|uniref:Uncharacterized protein n=1 Tax=Anisakis simplex TaxID=6269 RepID=A0A0M3KB51_ANISI|nr:unnamed protein product [Anisakis simplex]
MPLPEPKTSTSQGNQNSSESTVPECVEKSSGSQQASNTGERSPEEGNRREALTGDTTNTVLDDFDHNDFEDVDLNH